MSKSERRLAHHKESSISDKELKPQLTAEQMEVQSQDDSPKNESFDSAARFFETMQNKSNSDLRNRNTSTKSSTAVVSAASGPTNNNNNKPSAAANSSTANAAARTSTSNLNRSNNSAATTSVPVTNSNNNQTGYGTRDSTFSEGGGGGSGGADHESLCGCCAHPSSCYEALVCFPCQVQRQLNALQPIADDDKDATSNACFLCYAFSWFFVIPALRFEVGSRLGSEEACCAAFMAGAFCPHLSLAQTHRQLQYLGLEPTGWFIEPYPHRME